MQNQPELPELIQDTEPQPISPLLQLGSAWTAWAEVKKISVLKALADSVILTVEARYVPGTWAVIGSNGAIYANPLHLAPLDEWKFVLAHLLLHLGLRHSVTPGKGWSPAQAAAYELTANTLALQLGVGTPPAGFLLPNIDSAEEWLIEADLVRASWKRNDVPIPLEWWSAAGQEAQDFVFVEPAEANRPTPDDWAMMLTRGLMDNLGKGGLPPWATVGMSKPRQALKWFADNFPLLSALAAHFDIIEDRETVEAFGISIAAVIPERMEIIVNPDVDLTPLELRFIMGHELMHVGLLHHKRRENRDAFVWNLACDFVINAWLIEMGVGEMPPRGGLYNPAFVGLSSNEIYDKLMQDPDFVKTMTTFRGVGIGDIMPNGVRGKARKIGNQDADEAAEALMNQGIKAHIEGKRGLLPAGLLEMVTPTPTAAPPWKLALTKWFESHFEPIAPARSYARQSRRQQATPDIPRPRYAIPQLPDGSGVFGVILDTSGSMTNQLLGQCLGAITALAEKHQIKQVRLVFCDATPYDEGYVPIRRLSEPIQLKGRGGTKLQPGIELLNKADDFPKDAPILVITDGDCDQLKIERDHAFLLPDGKRLPFAPVGPVFTLK